MAVDAVGAAAASRACLECVRKGGQLLQIGLPDEPVGGGPHPPGLEGGPLDGDVRPEFSAWQKTLRLMEEGRVDMEAMVSDTLPLEDWETGFKRMERGEGLKILFELDRA